jgi:hypothetical protein
LYAQPQVLGIEHPYSGRRGASADKKRLLHSDFTNSQHVDLGVTQTACHLLSSAIRDARRFRTWSVLKYLAFTHVSGLLWAPYATPLGDICNTFTVDRPLSI